MSAPHSHFTATVNIVETTRPAPVLTSAYDRRASAPLAPEREVVEVLSLVVRDETIEGLRAKIRAHLEVS